MLLGNQGSSFLLVGVVHFRVVHWLILSLKNGGTTSSTSLPVYSNHLNLTTDMNTFKSILQDKLMMFWLCMLLHLLADFPLQGILADLKQKSWWDQHTNCYNRKKYVNDHQMAMLCHALMWSLVTFSPLAFVVNRYAFSVIIIWNAWVHGTIDHFKANELKLNLVEDQTFHAIQIILTILLVYLF